MYEPSSYLSANGGLSLASAIADKLGLREDQLVAWLSSGQVPGVLYRGSWLTTRLAVENYLSRLDRENRALHRR